jgi:uncharacterized membrane protein
MYFYDPRQGRRRRARLRDRAHHVLARAEDLVSKAERDTANRVHGLAERIRHGRGGDAAEVIVEARVRAQIGRLTSHPAAIRVDVRGGGVVVLSGPILASEARRLVRRIRRVAGVHAVTDFLERHDKPDLSALQGGGRVVQRRRTLTPAGQLIAAAAGSLLAAGGLARGGWLGRLIAAAGGLLAARALTNQPVRELLGIGDGHGVVEIEKRITVQAPVAAVYELWSHVENFPRFMEHVREIRLHADDLDRSHWVVDGTPGTHLWFDAEICQREPNRAIAWRTLPGQAIDHAGLVLFEELGDGATRVHVHMLYRPPAGRLGHTVARLLGWDPKSRMNEDLIRMKGLLERGHTRAHHARVTLGDVH